MSYRIRYAAYPSPGEGPPDPEEWIGPPGPAGPAGPPGIQGEPGADGTGAVHSVAGKAGDVILIHTDITDWTAATASLGAVQSVAGRIGAVILSHTDITDWASATSALVPSSGNIIAGLGYMPYDAANPANYQTDVQVSATVTASVANYVPLGQRAAANGVATLDATGVVPTLQLPGAVTGTLTYLGGWNASTNTPVLASGALSGGVLQAAGRYYLVTVGATTAAIDGTTTWVAGDWISSNGTVWQRVQNSTSPYLPIAGGTVGPGALNTSLLNLASSDLTKALTITPQDDLPADICVVDEFGNVGMVINPNGSLDVSQNYVSLPNTTIYEVSDGINSITVQDDFGFVAFMIDANGIVEAQTLQADTVVANTVTTGSSGPLTGASVVLPYFSITELNDGLNDVLFADEFGFVPFGILGVDGTVIGGGSSSGGTDTGSFSSEVITDRDALATALSMSVEDNTNGRVAAPVWTYNHLISYGQSINMGTNGTPRLSTNEGLDTLCLGVTSSGSQANDSNFFTPLNNSNFNALDGAAGFEVPAISAVNQWRKLQLNWRQLATDTTRRLVVNTCGQGGTAIEQLSKGATPELYQQVPSLVTQAKAAATAAGGSYGVPCVIFIQGDSNYASGSYDHTQAGYLAKWEQLRSDLTTDIMAITGQKDPPLFVTAQANAFFDHTGDTSAIGNAQIQAALTAPQGDYLACNYYQVPNTSVTDGHCTNEGYRQLGSTLGKVMHKLLDRRDGWQPLYATKATFRGNQVLLACHTPEPPLQVQPVWSGPDGSTLVSYTDAGFRMGDDLGVIGITQVQTFNSVILLTASKTLDASLHPWVQYGDQTNHAGMGNICDTDPFQSFDTSALFGGPYPMWNWMLQFRMNVVSDV